jgi:uncharacterized Zn finger protein (UPF0148 family)
MVDTKQLKREGVADRVTWDFVRAEAERNTVRCPRCRIPMGNTGSFLCPTCQSGMPARYVP